MVRNTFVTNIKYFTDVRVIAARLSGYDRHTHTHALLPVLPNSTTAEVTSHSRQRRRTALNNKILCYPSTISLSSPTYVNNLRLLAKI